MQFIYTLIGSFKKSLIQLKTCAKEQSYCIIFYSVGVLAPVVCKGDSSEISRPGAEILQFLCLQVWPYKRQIVCVCVCTCVHTNRFTQTGVTGSWPVGQVITLPPAPSCGFLLWGPPLLMIAGGGTLTLVCVHVCSAAFVCLVTCASVRCSHLKSWSVIWLNHCDIAPALRYFI